jgi:hypothetical protein
MRTTCGFPVVSTTYTFPKQSFISLSLDIHFAILPKYYLCLITEHYMCPLIYCPVQFPATKSNPPLAVDLRNCDFLGHYNIENLPRSGGRRKTTPRDDRILFRSVKTNRRQTLKDVTARFNQRTSCLDDLHIPDAIFHQPFSRHKFCDFAQLLSFLITENYM